jgi:PAS domain S-box-containing protein
MVKKPTYEELEQRVKELERVEFERKAVVDALRESDKRHSSIIHKIQAAIVVHGADTRIIDCNFKALQLLGLTEDQVLGKTAIDSDWKFFNSDGERMPLEEYPANQVLATRQPLRDLTAGIYRPNKLDQVWVLANADPVSDHKGSIQQVIVTFMDITERKRAEEVLLEREERFRLLSEASFEGIAIADKGIVLEANDQFASMLGYEPSQIIGMTLTDIVAPESRSLVVEHVRSGSEEPLEFLALKKDGSTFEIEAHGRAIPYEGRSVRGAAFRDLSDRKQLESQLRQAHKMEAIGTLAGGIAHEFNNILGIIIGSTELAIDDVPEWNPAKNCLEEIRSASLRAKDMVSHILSFARKSMIERKPVPMSPIIRDSLKLLRATLPSIIDIRQDLTCEYDTVLGDPTQINQVLVNICTNAAHAMREEGGVLDVKLEDVVLDEKTSAQYEDLSAGNYVKLTIKDTGHGIKPEIIDQIFDPFFTAKEVGEGTGMGLSVVHGIIKSHGGVITVHSELGKGAVFEVLLPTIEAEIEPQTVEQDELPLGDEKILFVDDEESLVELVPQMLERLGYQVKAKTNPNQALELFRSNPDEFDLVISDMTMPQMTGDKLAKQLMKTRPNIPIIISTGFSEKMDEDKAKEMGISAVAMKPLVMRTLALTVRKVLDEK